MYLSWKCFFLLFFSLTRQDQQEVFLRHSKREGKKIFVFHSSKTQKPKCRKQKQVNCSFRMFLLLSQVHGGAGSHTGIAKKKKKKKV